VWSRGEERPEGERWRGGRIIYGFGFAEEIAIVGMIKVRGCTLFFLPRGQRLGLAAVLVPILFHFYVLEGIFLHGPASSLL
jgi:hypothetical protein